jgi:hypothetical protein
MGARRSGGSFPVKAILTAVRVRNGPPMSRSRDLGALVAKRPDLQQAVIIADPDFLVHISLRVLW